MVHILAISTWRVLKLIFRNGTILSLIFVFAGSPRNHDLVLQNPERLNLAAGHHRDNGHHGDQRHRGVGGDPLHRHDDGGHLHQLRDSLLLLGDGLPLRLLGDDLPHHHGDGYHHQGDAEAQPHPVVGEGDLLCLFIC